ncbi:MULTISPECIES: restriction endonuclease subunit S [Streptococcus]|nr:MULTISPECIES: restriction endonuclease subunit S [Streptococcus]MDU1467662.1 restriction endonuclease subunit S [Streptococcus mitis]
MSVPRIRVDGFNKNFEKKIFGEIVRSESTRMYIKSVVSDLGKYEVIQQGDIPILGYSDDRPFEKYKSVILFGDHTLSLYRPKAPFLLATDGIKILQSTILKRDYLYYLTQNYIPKSQGYKRHFSVLKQVFVNYSRDSSEQSAIGSLFRTLDDLLASYKDNLTNYQSLKTTMLSMMFPKNGQTVPEIRLDGFEGEWKFIKLGEAILEAYQGINTASDKVEYSISGIPILQAKHITNGQINYRDTRYLDMDIYEHYISKYMPKKGEILFANIGTIGPSVLVDSDEMFLIAWNILKMSIKDNYSSLFIKITLSLLDSKYIFERITTGNATKFINKDEIMDIRISVPSIEEQQAIGAYFSNLDKLINSHQEKISQLETLKKKLLQDMFI